MLLVIGMEMRELDMSDSETEFLLDPIRDQVNPVFAQQSYRNRRKRVRKIGTILRFVCG